MNWKQKTVLVTGAGGFIGSHLTERLVELGAKTRALIHYNSQNSWGWLEESSHKSEIEVVLGDVRDHDNLAAVLKDVDIVFHLASLIAIPYSYRAPVSYIRTNIEGTANVLQAALNAQVARVIHTSTSEVYGTAQYVPIDESHPLQGQSPYSATKIGADKIVESFHRSFELPVSTVRPFNTYGPRQSARAIIPTIISQALMGDELRLGNLEPTRDLTFVRDTAEGFVKMAECEEAVGQVVNLGSGAEISVGRLAETILELTGRDLPIVCESARARPEGSEVQRLHCDNRKAADLLGWRPEHPLQDGLAETIAWVEGNLERFKTHYTV